jgi:hypothetical protein
MISDNIKSIKQRIARSCEKKGRSPDSVKLVCITKESDMSQAEEVLRSGVRDLGENRVQELAAKYKAIGDKAVWHLVGHLQTNKVKDAIRMASLIHSVDSLRLAEAINKEAEKAGKVQDILVEVNTSQEASKFGFDHKDVFDFMKEVFLYSNINIAGLMTMAPEVDDPEKARGYFRFLQELRGKINELHITNHDLQELSMGMSNDFDVAVEEGATMVRIGRAIFR